MSDGGVRLREAQQQVAHLELSLVQVRGEAQALRAEMETQRNRATQLEQLFQQQVSPHCMYIMLPSARPMLSTQPTSNTAPVKHCLVHSLLWSVYSLSHPVYAWL